MDRINEIAESCRKKLREASLRKVLVLYLVMAVFIALIAMLITCVICENWKDIIRQVNAIDEDYRYIGEGDFAINFVSDGVVIRKTDMVSRSMGDTCLLYTSPSPRDTR